MKFMRVSMAAGLLGGAVLWMGLTSGGAANASLARTRTNPQSELPVIALSSPVTGFTQPVSITHAGDNTPRVFVVQQTGQIRIIKNGALLPAPFLDIAGRISTGGERGLLGLAFPPGYSNKGYFYVNYTNTAGHTVIARFERNLNNPDLADPGSEQIVLTIDQPFANHNGGQLAFSPRDGLLYVGMGDGGSGDDPGNRAQNPAELLGKILRLDVERGRPYTYTVPATNPFINTPGFRPEIWTLGLRNPWRFSFDQATADLYVADVGQNAFEEVNFQAAASAGGENYGWRIMEGANCFNPPTGCSAAGLTLPVWQYDRRGTGDCSVTGGFVSRGGRFPRMQGRYFYGDFCSGRIWGLRFENGAWVNSLMLDTTLQISTFGDDEAGNLYVAGYNNGTVYTITDSVTAPTPQTPTVQFSAATYTVAEGAGRATVTVIRTESSVPLSVDYLTSDGTASERTDYSTALGTLRFAAGEISQTVSVFITDDAFAEAQERINLTLRNPSGGTSLGIQSSAEVVIDDDDATTPATNPIDSTDFFVRQHYIDFLNREPDAAGFQFWRNNIESCGADAQCRAVKRIDTSAAFFLSIEFQQTGFFVYRFSKAAFGESPRFRLFTPDTQEIGRGVVIGQPGANEQLETNRQAFADSFVARREFMLLYPQSQTPAQYVDALNVRAGGVLSTTERDALVRGLTNGTETRATVLRHIAEDTDFVSNEFNSAFVLMQYFGYLRRNPDDAPDNNLAGFNFWLDKLNEFGGDFRRAEMVKAFITSAEYRQRFGQ